MTMPILNALASQLPLIGAVPYSPNPKTAASKIVPMLAAIGANVARVELPWSDTETVVGTYAPPAYADGLIAALRSAGKSVVVVLDYGNALYPGSGAFNLPPRDAASIAAFANYAAWAVTQYAGPDVWFEIYNEPNNGQFWASAANPAQYAALLSACVSKMRAANPSANIMTGGVGPAYAKGSITDQSAFMKSVSAAAGAAVMAQINAQAIHPYDSGNPPEAIFNFIAGVSLHWVLCRPAGGHRVGLA